jgi:hypothetical protein
VKVEAEGKVEAEAQVSLVKQADADNLMIATENQDARLARAKLPRVGVVILNYNGKALAEQCIRSVFEFTVSEQGNYPS